MKDDPAFSLSEPERNDPEYVAQFEELFKAVGAAIRDHMSKEPYLRGAVYRTLNVLAAHVATVLAGCNDPEADRFFHACLNGTLQQAREDIEAGEIAKRHSSG